MSLYTRIIDLQKLTAAWKKVRKNKPAAGVDNVTWEIFDERSKEELKQLQMELLNQTYEVLTVRNVTLYKEEKMRVVSLYSMRDKVVQASMATELNRIYEPKFAEAAYAYRMNKSALNALEKIEAACKSGNYGAVAKLDIRHFFDELRWGKLEQVLRRNIPEDDVIDLIHRHATARVLEETGELVDKSLGIQGVS